LIGSETSNSPDPLSQSILIFDVKSNFVNRAVIPLEQLPPKRSDAEDQQLIGLATFAATCRTATERNSYSREIEIVPEPERPARLVKVLDRLRAGMVTIGMDRDEIWPVIRKVAFDSLPEARSRIIRVLQDAGDELPNLYELATASGCSASTTRRHLEDLDHYGAISRQKASPSRGDEYRLSEWAERKLNAISTVPGKSHEADPRSLPETSREAQTASIPGKSHSAVLSIRDKSGKPPEGRGTGDISETSRPGIVQALGKSER